MMKFRISDIPEGTSERELTLNEETFSLGDIHYRDGRINVTLIKMHGIIRVQFKVNVTMELTCDRSLDGYDFPAETNYEILFKSGAEHSEDEHSAIRPLNISGNTLDIEQEVRDSLLLSIPVKKIHPRYLDENGNVTDFEKVFADHDASGQDDPDSRWAALNKLKKKQNN
jgi:uncharacterized metal-binding protein YceD (DUF177 family)